MAKINYERLNTANFIRLGSVTTGNVIKWEDGCLYVVTNSYEDVKDEACYRRIMNITNRLDFGQVEYVDENTKVEIVEDVEITIKY